MTKLFNIKVPTVFRTCQSCGVKFSVDIKAYQSLRVSDGWEMPKTCPSCLDKRYNQGEHSVAPGGRKLLHEFTAEIRIPSYLFSPYEGKDGNGIEGLRATITGADLPGPWGGKSWNGRIDIFVPGVNILPRMGRVRVMKKTRAAPLVREEIHGEPMGEKQEVKQEYAPEFVYLAIDTLPADTPPEAALVLAVTNRKTTFKGFGLQWSCAIDDQSLWSVSLSNSSRSSRFGQEGVVAIVDDSHPLVVSQSGGVETRREFTLEDSRGMRDEWVNFPDCEASGLWRSVVGHARENGQDVVDFQHVKWGLQKAFWSSDETHEFSDESKISLVDMERKAGWAVIELSYRDSSVAMQITVKPKPTLRQLVEEGRFGIWDTMETDDGNYRFCECPPDYKWLETGYSEAIFFELSGEVFLLSLSENGWVKVNYLQDWQFMIETGGDDSIDDDFYQKAYQDPDEPEHQYWLMNTFFSGLLREQGLID